MTDAPGSRLRILLVDDHAIVRVGLRNLIEDEPDLVVCGEAATGQEALRLSRETHPDVVVLDLRLPDISGVDLVEDIRGAPSRPRVLVLTSYADDTLLLSALKAGVDGYLLKDTAAGDLVDALRRVGDRGAVATVTSGLPGWSPREKAGPGPANGGGEALTGQERRVFELVGRGHSNREVAERTGLSEKTVRNYLTRVFAKLGLTRRSELVAVYVSQRAGPGLGRGRS